MRHCAAFSLGTNGLSTQDELFEAERQGRFMTWIRSPWWDRFWILSGLPVGLALLFLPPQALLVFFTLVVVLETSHSLSPIVLAWTHAEFRRRVVLARPMKFIALPGAV